MRSILVVARRQSDRMLAFSLRNASCLGSRCRCRRGRVGCDSVCWSDVVRYETTIIPENGRVIATAWIQHGYVLFGRAVYVCLLLEFCIATCDHLHFCQVIVRGLSRASSPWCQTVAASASSRLPSLTHSDPARTDSLYSCDVRSAYGCPYSHIPVPR